MRQLYQDWIDDLPDLTDSAVVEPPPAGFEQMAPVTRSHRMEHPALGIQGDVPCEDVKLLRRQGWRFLLAKDDFLELVHLQAWYFQVRFFPRLRWSMVPTRRLGLDVGLVTTQVSGKSVSHVALPDAGRLAIHFTDGSTLLVERLRQGVTAALVSGKHRSEGLTRQGQPTRRQQEYLQFITRYIVRFGVSPAESDIQRHFLLSAPSVNQMVQTLERRGFITRERGVPRSIRVVSQP